MHTNSRWKGLVCGLLAAVVLSCAACGGGATTVFPGSNDGSGSGSGMGGSNLPSLIKPPLETFQDLSPATDDAATSWLKDAYQTLPPADDADGVYQNTSLKTWSDEILRLVNNERVKNGLNPLQRNKHLDYVAQAHARDMGLRNYFNHTAQSYGLSPFQRMDAVNPAPYQNAGENIAAGQHSPSEVMIAWMASPGHRSNILNTSYEYMGVGVYYDAGDGQYREQWVQLFASFNGDPEAGHWIEP